MFEPFKPIKPIKTELPNGVPNTFGGFTYAIDNLKGVTPPQGQVMHSVRLVSEGEIIVQNGKKSQLQADIFEVYIDGKTYEIERDFTRGKDNWEVRLNGKVLYNGSKAGLLKKYPLLERMIK